MRSRVQDVDDFLKGVKELEERTQKEDKDRLERIKSAPTTPYIPDESRFARMKAREDDLRHERESRANGLEISKPTHVSPPNLPKRPEAKAQDSCEPPLKPKGFIASAIRHSGPDGPSAEPLRLSPAKKTPEKQKPSWITSAMNQSQPERSPERATERVERSPTRQYTRQALNQGISEPGSPLSISKSRPSTPLRPLKPQNAGVDPKFAPRTGTNLKPAVVASPANKDPQSPPSSRTPSQSLKDARLLLAKKPKPTMGKLTRSEDPIKEFREQLVLEPKQKIVLKETSKPASTQKFKSEPKEELLPAFKVDKKPAPKPAPKPNPRREPSVPEALRKRSLKPALATRKVTPPKAEAHERLRMLRPAQALKPQEEETPEALQRMKSLAKPPKMERPAEPEPDSVTRLRNLKPKQVVEKEPAPSPEALERLKSLRKAKPKQAVEEVIPEAITRLNSLRSNPQATKPHLQRTPNTNLRQTASTSDFRLKLNSALANPPSSSEGTPLRKTKTDIQDQQAPLEHLTKSRPRGPKRKLPSATKAQKATDKLASAETVKKPEGGELELPKRAGLRPIGSTGSSGTNAKEERSFSRDELRRLASAKRKPKNLK